VQLVGQIPTTHYPVELEAQKDPLQVLNLGSATDPLSG